MGVINKLFGRLRVVSDSNVTTQTSSVIQADSGNTNLVIAPSGTGAIVASVPDGAVTGGNARGTNAVDLQMSRAASNQVASGANSVSIGGIYNTVSGARAVSIGGQTNTANGTDAATIGGSNNTAGNASIVGGLQNTISGQRSFGTGYSNTATGGHNIVGGWVNTVGGDRSVAFGTGNNASGQNAFAIGDGTFANGNQSFSQGNNSSASTLNSIAMGYGGFTALDNQLSLGNRISYPGDVQTSRVVYSINTGQVSSGGNYTFTGGQLIIPKNNAYGSGVTQAYFCTAKFIYGARSKTGTVTTINNKDCFTAVYNFAAKSTQSFGSSLIGTPTLQLSFSDANLAATVVSITLGASGEILFNFTPPTWTGGGTIEFRGTLHLEFTEIGLY
jgi:hypothetical protein